MDDKYKNISLLIKYTFIHTIPQRKSFSQLHHKAHCSQKLGRNKSAFLSTLRQLFRKFYLHFFLSSITSLYKHPSILAYVTFGTTRILQSSQHLIIFSFIYNKIYVLIFILSPSAFKSVI